MENIGIETEQIEYKKTTGEIKEAITSIVAILNKHGAGELYFGIRNNGDVLGQEIEKLGLFSKDGVHLLNAGASLFCACTTNDVQMAKFATDVKVTFTDIRREDKGSIIGLSKVCEQYIIDAMDWKADIIGLERVETPEIPIEAIREAVINSYGHRLYNNNQCNEIDVFKDRIEIHTTGGFPKGHTPEEFLDGNKKAIRRNKLITGVLYYSKDMETFATGLKRIKDLCDKAGCKVEFRNEKDDFVVVFYRNLRETWVKEQRKNNIEADSKHQDDVLDDVLEDVLENKIIKLLSEDNKFNQKQIATKTGMSVASVQRAMKKLVEQGKVIREGGKRFGYWKIK